MLVVLTMSIVLATLATPMAAVGAGSRCRVRVPAEVETGAAFLIRGTRFVAERPVTVRVAGPTGTQTLRVTTDANGAFRLRLAAAWSDQGRWKVTARAGKGTRACTARASYVVTPGASPTPTAAAPWPVASPVPDSADLLVAGSTALTIARAAMAPLAVVTIIAAVAVGLVAIHRWRQARRRS
jgi:hypothetical protein